MNSLHADTSNFIKLVRHPVKFRMFLFLKLPSAFFSGVRVIDIDEAKAVIKVPYKWFSQNPFKSTYFACLAMAAEMSTGLLCMTHTNKSLPAVSMLVTGIEGRYFKKATGITVFTCVDGESIKQIVHSAIESKEGRLFKAQSLGKNKNGEIVAEFFITWSFKVKK